MNERPSPESEPADLPADLANKITEMKGYSEIGMAREALQIAKSLLKCRPVHPCAFKHALSTILIQADRCRTWRRLVERAYAQSPARTRKAVRADMLDFYVSVPDYEAAFRFIVKRPTNLGDIVFSLWTLLNLRKPEQAKPLWRKCRRLLSQAQDPFTLGMLLDALADYHAQIGDLRTAEAYLRVMPPGQPFFDGATSGLVEIQAVRGYTYVAAGRAVLDNPAANADPHLNLVLPGNQQTRTASASKRLKKYSAALSRIVPPSEMWRFGFDPANL